MAKQTKPEVTVYDLTRNVPEGVSLSGLSAPKFDGANYYRQPTAQASAVEFVTPDNRFVQFEYQLYSPGSAVTSQAVLGRTPLGKKTFPAGQFVNNSVWGGFVLAGQHQVSLSYICNPTCKVPPSQYWTKLTLIKDARVRASEVTGLGTERLWLNAPRTELRVTGTGPLTFDGANYRRPVEAERFTLSWPQDRLPLNVGFTINSGQPFRVTTRVDDKILAVQKGDAKAGVSPVLSLVDHPQARSITVEVDCLSTPQCASLYFPNVSVRIPPTISVPPVVTGGLTLMLLGAAALLLGVGPRPRRG